MLACVAGCSWGRDARPPEARPFSVLTYNLFVDVRDADANADAILAGEADIVCLQEVTPAWERALRSRLDQHYPHAIYRHGSPAGLAVLSKYPLEVTSSWRSAAGWPGLLARVTMDARVVQVMALHLRPPFVDKGGLSLRAFLRWPSAHRTEIREAWSKIDATLPLVVAGDMNEADRGVASRWLTETRGMTNALGRHAPKDQTWQLDVGFTILASRLDHIFHSDHFRSTSARVIRRGRSDHYPVVATLAWADPTPR